jgi:hypothetical protein
MKSRFPVTYITLTSFLVLILFMACVEKPDKGRGLFPRRQRAEEALPVTPEKEVPAVKLTPEKFVEITIRYQRETRGWLEESQVLPEKEQEAYLEKMNKEFFAKLGMTEEEYVEYSQNHIEELNVYIGKHPELMVELMEQ